MTIPESPKLEGKKKKNVFRRYEAQREKENPRKESSFSII